MSREEALALLNERLTSDLAMQRIMDQQGHPTLAVQFGAQAICLQWVVWIVEQIEAPR